MNNPFFSIDICNFTLLSLMGAFINDLKKYSTSDNSDFVIFSYRHCSYIVFLS